jgi:hypothetical protein
MNNFLRYFGNFRKTETGLREYVDYTGRKFILNPMTQKWESGGMVLSEQQMSMFTLHSFDDPSGGGGKKIGLVPIISLLFTGGLPFGVTFQRSTAETTYLGSDGIIKKTSSSHEARFEYDFNGNPLGLLMEPESKNLIIDGITFYNKWATSSAFISFPSNLGATLLSNAGTAPDNSNQANRIALNITPASDASLSSIIIKKAVTIESNNVSHVFSFWAKNTIGATYIAASITRSTTADDKWFGMVADLSGNTFKTYQASTAPGITFASLERYPNDWYRISVGTTADSAKGISACIGIVNSFGASFSNTGEPKNTSISSSDPYGFTGLFWGAQVERGFSPTSFIPTDGSVVTRTAETASFNDIANTIGEEPSNIAINCEFDCKVPEGGIFPEICRLLDTTSFGLSGLYECFISRNSSNKNKINFGTSTRSTNTENGVPGLELINFQSTHNAIIDANTLNKIAISYNPNLISGTMLRSFNNTSLSSSAGVTAIPTSLDKLFIGCSDTNTNVLNGHIKQIKIYNQYFDQTQLNNFTT